MEGRLETISVSYSKNSTSFDLISVKLTTLDQTKRLILLIQHEFDLTLFNWFELAKDVKYKKFGDSKFLDYKEKSKQKRFLQSRGFGFDEINQAFQ
mgnify:CR=1 FL=1